MLRQPKKYIKWVSQIKITITNYKDFLIEYVVNKVCNILARAMTMARAKKWLSTKKVKKQGPKHLTAG